MNDLISQNLYGPYFHANHTLTANPLYPTGAPKPSAPQICLQVAHNGFVRGFTITHQLLDR